MHFFANRPFTFTLAGLLAFVGLSAVVLAWLRLLEPRAPFATSWLAAEVTLIAGLFLGPPIVRVGCAGFLLGAVVEISACQLLPFNNSRLWPFTYLCERLFPVMVAVQQQPQLVQRFSEPNMLSAITSGWQCPGSLGCFWPYSFGTRWGYSG